MMASALSADDESAPIGRRERKKRETHDRILAAASELFAKNGFDATTVEEITEAVDLSRATFFKHFSEKSAVVAELGDAMTDTFIAQTEAAAASTGSIGERFETLFEDAAERLVANGELSRALIFETVGRRRDLAERRGRTARMHEAIEAMLRDGIDRGEVRSDIPLALLGQMVAGAYLEILLTWVVDPDYPLDERLRQAVKVIESMVCVAPPAGGE